MKSYRLTNRFAATKMCSTKASAVMFSANVFVKKNLDSYQAECLRDGQPDFFLGDITVYSVESGPKIKLKTPTSKITAVETVAEEGRNTCAKLQYMTSITPRFAQKSYVIRGMFAWQICLGRRGKLRKVAFMGWYGGP